MILDRIKDFFKRKRNTCLFMYITNLHYVPIYLHPNLNKYEREVNKRALKTSKIVTVNHGIKIFSRFLKYHNSYEIYKRDLKYCRININDVIRFNFITPFDDVIRYIMRYEHPDYIKKYESLQEKWEEFLKSTNYI